MCFSAGASFAGGGTLILIGVATVIKANKPAEIPFASIPLIFGIQQISEGFVWTSLQSHGSPALLGIATYIFLITALVIWPVYLPFSILFMEEAEGKRKKMKFLLFAGIVTSLFYGIGLAVYDVTPEILSHHIRYTNIFPRSLSFPVFLFYLTATLVPLFISSVRKMHMFGILMAASCLVTGVFLREYLTSIWCFFAALISMVIWWILGTPKESPDEPKIMV